ncbi:hypothetical protein Glove_139g106 [Diversispora epigaea]|uniref:Uncharacterized protein n=1 Tax=Diversispora epigaea TaxID=1348612 RepID=A0A397IVR8_9GLOM|nr:hypothetical protein Glove_139g106 [Diversispora epigaea]
MAKDISRISGWILINYTYVEEKSKYPLCEYEGVVLFENDEEDDEDEIFSKDYTVHQ